MSSATLQHAAFILRGNPITGIAAIGAALLIFVGIFGPWIVPYDPIASNVQTPDAAECRALGRHRPARP
jgi:peptide/nickel transport system permease protein